MEAFAQQVIDGIAAGTIYASLALAIVLVYRTSHVINLAQGEMALLMAYVFWAFTEVGVPMPVAFVFSIVLAFALGVGVERIIIRPLSSNGGLSTNEGHLSAVIVTLGLFLILNNVVGWVWGYLPKSVPSPFPDFVWTVAGVRITSHSIGMGCVMVVLVTALYVFFTRTKPGLAIRAQATNFDSSRLSGIRANRMVMLSWGIASVLGATAAILVAPRLYLQPDLMFGVLIYSVAAATLGGFDSFPGAVVGGIVVGVAENLAGRYIPWIGSDLKIVVAMVLIVTILLVKPAGLFGQKDVVRA